MQKVNRKWRRFLLNCAVMAAVIGGTVFGAPLLDNRLYAIDTPYPVCCFADCLFGTCYADCPNGGTCHCRAGFPRCRCY